MFSLRPIRQPSFLRSLTSSSATTSPQTFAVTTRRFADHGYGSGAQKQGTPNAALHHEHPGPSKPTAAKQGNGEQQGEATSEPQKESSASGSSSKPQPKILNESPPSGDEVSEDVAKHNREMDQRAEKPHEEVKKTDGKNDNVEKGFWSGR